MKSKDPLSNDFLSGIHIPDMNKGSNGSAKEDLEQKVGVLTSIQTYNVDNNYTNFYLDELYCQYGAKLSKDLLCSIVQISYAKYSELKNLITRNKVPIQVEQLYSIDKGKNI